MTEESYETNDDDDGFDTIDFNLLKILKIIHLSRIISVLLINMGHKTIISM